MVSKPRFCCSVEKITPISQCLPGGFTEIVLISYTFLNFFNFFEAFSFFEDVLEWVSLTIISSSILFVKGFYKKIFHCIFQQNILWIFCRSVAKLQTFRFTAKLNSLLAVRQDNLACVANLAHACVNLAEKSTPRRVSHFHLITTSARSTLYRPKLSASLVASCAQLCLHKRSSLKMPHRGIFFTVGFKSLRILNRPKKDTP